MKKYFLVLALLLPLTSLGQFLGFEEVDPSDIRPWTPEQKAEYLGVYYFGESEGESQLVLIETSTSDGLIAQISWMDWDESRRVFVPQFQNLTDVRLDKKGNFYSKEYQGEFVVYEGDEKPIRCLKIYDFWGNTEGSSSSYDLGYQDNETFDTFYAGKYPEASTRVLDVKELKKLFAEELQIMRNEIFARYGYIFRAGGKMDRYFRAQDWYRAHHADVNAFLTVLEKENIKRIQLEEKQR
ncbi:MAG: YARHG domain-containing protein [Bacteroidota bacterium]